MYLGGRSHKWITMEGGKEDFLSTRLIDKSWSDLTKDHG